MSADVDPFLDDCEGSNWTTESCLWPWHLPGTNDSGFGDGSKATHSDQVIKWNAPLIQGLYCLAWCELTSLCRGDKGHQYFTTIGSVSQSSICRCPRLFGDDSDLEPAGTPDLRRSIHCCGKTADVLFGVCGSICCSFDRDSPGIQAWHMPARPPAQSRTTM